MDTFLKLVAKDLYKKKGNDLSRVMVVFPNKRARLFLNEYLAHESSLPIWSPAYTSISELFESLSPLKQGDPIKLITELYKVYSDEMQNDETLDDFYFWGELLLSDFDDIDKNMVNADQLFGNLKDIKRMMDGLDFLDEEQEAAIQQFFHNFSIERRTELKERFISIWDKLGNIYNRYKQNLLSAGIAYEGMIYRDGIERLNTGDLLYDTYTLVGFNVLNKVEYKLFEELQAQKNALFYWDYDVFYTETLAVKHEAGIYINKNLKNFPPSLDKELFDNLIKPKTVRIISASTENAQARYLPEWVESIDYEKEKENAVVLCNETLLLPVLHSIPDDVKNVNITMGFPLSQTPAYTFVNALLELQASGFDAKSGRYFFRNVEAVLKHPYTRQLSAKAESLEDELTRNNKFYPLPSELKRDELLTLIFTPQITLIDLCGYVSELLKAVTAIYREEHEYQDLYNQLYRESLFKCYTIINRLQTLMQNGDLKIRQDTFRKLIQKILLSTHIPFHGEPAIGMQVMGVLETRNLDFKNIIIMSLNEGLMPKTAGDSSFIPYSLRKAFGMSTIEHKDAIYAYYFYRMIQRAENVTLLYNTSSDGLNQGEISRFLLQFLVEWPNPVEQSFLQAGQSPGKSEKITIDKSEKIMERLHSHYDSKLNEKGRFSPSALNTYLDCRLRFYYQYIARIQKPEEIKTEIDSSTFGSIFHKSVELIYRKLTETGKLIRKEDLEKLLKSDRIIQDYVDRAFKELFFHVNIDETPEYNGIQLINSKVIVAYVKQLLRNDLQYAPFEMVDMEKNIVEVVKIQSGNKQIDIKIGGYIDRLDSKNGTLRIVDYKTGGVPKSPKNIQELFTRSDNRPSYIFQTFLYAAIMSRKQSIPVAPALLYIHRASSDTYSPVVEIGEARNKVPVNDFGELEKEFREKLQELLKEIFDVKIPFDQTENSKLCEYCDFKLLCKR